ncbi:MAG: transcription antitermination factor NusB [Aeriscardovia sp.]|nr:transcription antitermination factor NusB [Aeriscardovia sp.]
MARFTARRRALSTLYEADEKRQDFKSLLQERIAMPGTQTPLPAYAIEIVEGVAEHRFELNRILNDHSSWSINRMAVVDRNIMRIAAWEILYNPEISSAIAIHEAVQLAEQYSDADSPAFIHGVLSSIADDKTLVSSTTTDNSVSTDDETEIDASSSIQEENSELDAE